MGMGRSEAGAEATKRRPGTGEARAFQLGLSCRRREGIGPARVPSARARANGVVSLAPQGSLKSSTDQLTLDRGESVTFRVTFGGPASSGAGPSARKARGRGRTPAAGR